MTWFPQGKDDPDIIAIKVTIEEAECWEAPGNALARGYHLLKAIATQGMSQPGEHKKVALQSCFVDDGGSQRALSQGK